MGRPFFGSARCRSRRAADGKLPGSLPHRISAFSHRRCRTGQPRASSPRERRPGCGEPCPCKLKACGEAPLRDCRTPPACNFTWVTFPQGGARDARWPWAILPGTFGAKTPTMDGRTMLGMPHAFSVQISGRVIAADRPSSAHYLQKRQYLGNSGKRLAYFLDLISQSRETPHTPGEVAARAHLHFASQGEAFSRNSWCKGSAPGRIRGARVTRV